MAIEFSQPTLRGFGRKHLWKIIYEMAKQTSNQVDKKKLEKSFFKINQALEISNEREAEPIFQSVSDQVECQRLLASLERRLQVEVVDADFLVSTKDKVVAEAEVAPIVLILENLRSAFNVGNCFRSAESFLIEEVIVTGYTPTPENSKAAKSALGTEQWMRWRHFENSLQAIEELQAKNYSIYAIETSANSKSVDDVELIYPCAFVVGNERYGLAEATMEMVNGIIHIPMFGRKNSLNVSVCTGIVLQKGRGQWQK